MKRPSTVAILMLAALVPVLAACGDDDGGAAGPSGPFDLTFTGDASFQTPHGGQEIHVVVESSDGEVIASKSGMVAADEDPSFSFEFSGILEDGRDYVLKYWIDSNFGGGAPGVCDPPTTDHQWRIDINGVAEDVMVTDTHRPGDTESVCEAFAFDLEFTGDASFQGAHGGDRLTAAVVRTGSGVEGGSRVVATRTVTVSGSEDPAFSLDFSGVLARGQEYELHYWIDSNFGGGTVGVCDAPDVDHQWRLDIGSAGESVTISDSHRPAETEGVCDTFAFDLEFRGDGSFRAPHGGQTIHVSVVHRGIGEVVATETGTVSESANPSFDFDFPGVLVRGVEYHLDYWIDSNFGGGTQGVCDAPDVDHQWRISFGPVSDGVTIADEHRPAETQPVCSDTSSGDGDGGGGGDEPGY